MSLQKQIIIIKISSSIVVFIITIQFRERAPSQVNIMIKLITNISEMFILNTSDVHTTFKTEICIAPCTQHFIAAFNPLYWYKTFWTLFYFVITQKLIKNLATWFINMGVATTLKTYLLRACFTSTYLSGLIRICHYCVTIRTNTPNCFFICLYF